MSTPEAKDVNGRSEYELADARGFGVSEQDLRGWSDFSPLDIHWARRNGLGLGVARRWSAAGINVQDAIRACLAGLELEDVQRWVECGFAAEDAALAAEHRIDIATATAWRDIGFILPETALLLSQGWTLADAAVARVAGSDPYGRWVVSPDDDQEGAVDGPDGHA